VFCTPVRQCINNIVAFHPVRLYILYNIIILKKQYTIIIIPGYLLLLYIIIIRSSRCYYCILLLLLLLVYSVCVRAAIPRMLPGRNATPPPTAEQLHGWRPNANRPAPPTGRRQSKFDCFGLRTCVHRSYDYAPQSITTPFVFVWLFEL